jgi:triosephosphate isomerase
VICPSFTSLTAAVDAARGSNIRVGAQNIAWAKEGAFTGEISGPMLQAAGATHAIVGHSERRQYFCETDETVLKRTQAALEFGLTRSCASASAWKSARAELPKRCWPRNSRRASRDSRRSSSKGS